MWFNKILLEKKKKKKNKKEKDPSPLVSFYPHFRIIGSVFTSLSQMRCLGVLFFCTTHSTCLVDLTVRQRANDKFPIYEVINFFYHIHCFLPWRISTYAEIIMIK